jgi:hypothetical protein
MHHTPQETLTAYTLAFESLDPDAVVAFYDLPCAFISPVGTSVVPDRDSARRLDQA